MSNAQDCLNALIQSYVHEAEGDRCVMFAALYNKLKDPTLNQVRHKRPARTRVIHKTLESEFGIKGLPKWGATAVRGDLMDNKEHIRLFIDAVNSLAPYEIQDAWELCVVNYRNRMNSKYVPISFNVDYSLSEIIVDLCNKASGGRTQQPLCFAATKVLYNYLDHKFQVSTKKVFAGDAQSSITGDIQVTSDDSLVLVIEVKAHIADQSKIDEVLNDHGSHDYPLIIAAHGYKEPIAVRENLVLTTINGFIFSTLTHASVISGRSMETIYREALENYNNIMINLEDKLDLAVALP